jgi:peptide/nickel transport system permease protein
VIAYLIRSGFSKLVTLFFISVISFVIIHLAPGEPSQIDPLNPRFTKEDLVRYRTAFGLDQPLHIQYLRFYRKLFTGDLVAFKDNQPVLGKIFGRFLNSLPLFIVGSILTWCLAFPLGIRSALARGGAFDQVTTFLSFALLSLPGFFLAYLLIIFVVNTFQVPVLGLRTFGREGVGFLFSGMDRVWHLVLPSFLGATAGIAVLARYVRAQMIEVMSQEFVRTAQAKGLTGDKVYYVHALRNALLPFVTMFGMILPGLIGGSVIIETIFAWPGMGRMGFEAILARDYPIIISLNFVAAVLTLAGTLVSDLLYLWVDPRIKL